GVVRQLTWRDRSGKSVGAIGATDNAGLNAVELSPYGKRVAAQRAVNGSVDVWLIDATRGVPTRLTFDAANDGISLWAPDGDHVAFQSNRKGVFNLYWNLSSGDGVVQRIGPVRDLRPAVSWAGQEVSDFQQRRHTTALEQEWQGDLLRVVGEQDDGRPGEVVARWEITGNRNPSGPVSGSHCRRSSVCL